jgi:transposase
VFTESTSVGLDVHARSTVAAAIDERTGELVQRRMGSFTDEIVAWVTSMPGPVAATYEAGPTGFGLARSLRAAGVREVVAAPSKLQRPVGDRVKTDARDTVHLARLLRLGEIVEVTVPSVESESACDLVRAREDGRSDVMSAHHRVSKLLLQQSSQYSAGKAWTVAHDAWLRSQRFELAGL